MDSKYSFHDTPMTVSVSRKYHMRMGGLHFDVYDLVHDLNDLKKTRPYFFCLDSSLLQNLLIEMKVLVRKKTGFCSFALDTGEKFGEFLTYVTNIYNEEQRKISDVNKSIVLTASDPSGLVFLQNELCAAGLSCELSHTIVSDLAETGIAMCPVGILSDNKIQELIQKLTQEKYHTTCNGHIYCKA